MVKGRCPGSATWVSGRIVSKSGPVTYVVAVGDGKEWKCHVDQMKECLENEASSGAVGFEYSPAEEETEAEVVTDKHEAPASVPDTPLSQPLSEPQSGNSASESVPAQAEESTSDSEIEPGVDTLTTGVSHKYPLRDRAKHRRFK